MPRLINDLGRVVGIKRMSACARLCRYRHSLAERTLRGAVIGRRLSFGSDSEHGARLTALMYSVVETLALNGVDVRRWLAEWLKVCAANGGRAPPDLSQWLPWSMSPQRRRTLTGKA